MREKADYQPNTNMLNSGECKILRRALRGYYIDRASFTKVDPLSLSRILIELDAVRIERESLRSCLETANKALVDCENTLQKERVQLEKALDEVDRLRRVAKGALEMLRSHENETQGAMKYAIWQAAEDLDDLLSPK